MAKRKNLRKQNRSVQTPPENLEKKKKLTGILLIVFSVFLALSIVSNDTRDYTNLPGVFTDLFKVFSSDSEFTNKAAEIHNWMGIFGAFAANFLINSTIGYFSIVFAVLVFIWGYTLLSEQEFKSAVQISNFLLITAVILSAFFGVLRMELGLLENTGEVSGKVGDFFGLGIGRLLGGLGSIILLITIQFVAVVLTFDLKLDAITDKIKSIISGMQEAKEERTRALSEKREKEKTEKTVTKEAKKQEKAGRMPVEPGEKDEYEPHIRIMKKDKEDYNTYDPDDSFVNDEEPQISRSEEEDIPEIDPESEQKLPDQWEEVIKYDPPKLNLLNESPEENFKVPEEELTRNAELLQEKLKLFDIEIKDISVTPGPVVTLYEIVPAPGVKISRIVSLENDIALALAARGIRIIAPIPGKSAIGVEIPNAQSEMVTARMVLSSLKNTKAQLPLVLGKTINGDIYTTDLASMPHLLIAGSTGSGKSVGINMMITSLIYAKHPSDIKFVIVDPKKIELSFYKKLNKHFLAVSPDLDEEVITNPQNALLVLKAVEYEMEKRYDKLAKAGVRNIVDYNVKIADPKKKPADTDSMKHYKMPYIVVIIDELADLMITSGKEVEEPISRIAQLARAVGIHLIVATQRPSVNVITGVIKANFSARVAYQVATKIDSRTILDMNGAEQLLGRGDMLFLPGGMPKPVRIQNAFISTDEVEEVTNFIYKQDGYSKRFFLPSMFEKKQTGSSGFITDLDEMFQEAAEVIVRHQQGSVSLLQRRLKLGYSRAARIVDQLEEAGIVGPSEGSKAREVLVENEEQLQQILKSL